MNINKIAKKKPSLKKTRTQTSKKYIKAKMGKISENQAKRYINQNEKIHYTQKHKYF